MWLTFFCVLTAAISCASLTVSVFAARRAARALESPPIRQRSVELKLQSAEDLLAEHTQAITDLTNRLKMMKVRSASSHATRSDNELPDPYRDPDGWRRAMNTRLAMNKVNGGG
jgi:hypothetical protein